MTFPRALRILGALAILTPVAPPAAWAQAKPATETWTLAGFEIRVTDDRSGRADERSGSGFARWPGAAAGEGVPVEFSGIRLSNGVAVRGAARGKDLRGVRVALPGATLEVEELVLTPDGGAARATLILPDRVAAAPRAIPLGELAIEAGGGFRARATVRGAGEPSADPRAVQAWLGGATVSVVHEPKRGVARVELTDALLRIPVVPPASGRDAAGDLFLVERPAGALLFGRAERLTFDGDGRAEAAAVRIVSPGAAPPGWSADVDRVVDLFLPKGFGLEIAGGTLSVEAGRVAAVDLSGRVHLPARYDAPPLAFAHLRRDGAGFRTETLTGGLPRVLLGEYSYRPARAELYVPGPVRERRGADPFADDARGKLPDRASELDDWTETTRAGLDEVGLRLWGGVLAAPWDVAEEPPGGGAAAPPPAPAPTPSNPGRRPVGGILGRADLLDRDDRIDRDRIDDAVRDGLPGLPKDPGRQPAPGRTPVPDLDPTPDRTPKTDGTPTPDRTTPTDRLPTTERISTSDRTFAADDPELPDPAPSGGFVADRIAGRGAAAPADEPAFVVDTAHRGRTGSAARSRAVLGPALATGAAGQAASLLDRLEDRVSFSVRHALQGGAFRLGSGGVEGRWILLADPEVRRIGKFRARVDRTYLRFAQSTVVDSSVRGRLMVPYPTSLSIPFEGALTASGEVLVPEDGLDPPASEQGWYLDYWKLSVFPRASLAAPKTRGDGSAFVSDAVTGAAAGAAAQAAAESAALRERVEAAAENVRAPETAREDAAGDLPVMIVGVANVVTPPPVLVFAQDRILVASAGMRPHVAAEYGGEEFRVEGADTPFEMSFAIRPDGNLADVDVRPAHKGAIEFLGIPFHPHRSSIELRRYIGNHRPPAAGEEPHPGWLLRMEGSLAFGLFGPREVRVHHTAMGARVPFVEPTARDENGRPAPVLADSGGALYVDARLRFVNTFGMPEGMVRRRFPPKDVDPNRPYQPDGGDNLAIEPFKAFIGEAKIELVGALSLNGLAEAGQWMRENGELNGYEKIGAGGGVDVVRAVLAAVRGMETVAQIGGGVVEITTGAKGLGAEVIHVATDAVSFGSSVVTTAVAVAGVVGSGGGSVTTLVEEVRHLVGNGLELGGSTVELLKAIYEQEPWYEPSNPLDPKTDPPYIALEVVQILLDAAALGVNFEELEPEQVAEVLLQTLDVSIPILQKMQSGDLELDQHVQFALAISHVVVKASRALVETGGIDEATAWDLAQRTVTAAQLFSELPQIRDVPELKHLPLALAVAQVTVDVGQGLRFGDEIDVASLVDLTDQILTIACERPDLVAPLFAATDVPERDAMNVMATSQTVFGALNHPPLFEGELTPQQAISQVLLPMLDGFVDGTAAGACAGLVRYDPYDGEVRALLRVARQVLRLADVRLDADLAEIDHQAMLEWAIGTVFESMQAVEVLQPGTIDDRLVAGVSNFGDAVRQFDPDAPPAGQLLRFSRTMMPTVRDVVGAIPDVDPAAPQALGVVEASLDMAVPLTEGQATDVATWLDGSLGVVTAMQELPLRADARAGLGLAGKALQLGRDGVRGTLTPPQAVRGAQEIVDLLRQHHAAGTFRTDLFASADAALLVPAQGLTDADLGRALDVASAVLDALADTLETGRLTIADLGTLLERVTVALAPPGGFAARGVAGPLLAANGDGDDFAALGAAISALPILDPTVSAEEATEAVLLALLDSEESRTSDPAVVSALQRARGALTAPEERIVHVLRSDLVDIGSYDEERSDRFVDMDGGVRTMQIQTTPGLTGTLFEAFLEAEYPVGHPAFPHGLHDLVLFRGNDLGSDMISNIRLIEDRLVERHAPELREYGLPDGARVRFEKRLPGDLETEGAIGLTEVSTPTAIPGFVSRVVRETVEAPQRLAPPSSIAGKIVEATWADAGGAKLFYDAQSGRLRIERTAGDRAGAREVRRVDAGLLHDDVATIPTGGALLAYVGPHPQHPGKTVEYRRGAPDVFVWDGASYDRLTIDGQLELFDGGEIPLAGSLIERRTHDAGADEDWLYRPGVHALRLDSCGGWEIHALGPLAGNVDAPDPASGLPFVGDLLARGDAFGAAERGDGAPLAAGARDALRLDLADGMAVLRNPEGDTAFLAAAGTLVLAPGSRRELERGACADGASGPRSEARPGGVRVARGADGAGGVRTVREDSATAAIFRERSVAGQTTAFDRRGDARRVLVVPAGSELLGALREGDDSVEGLLPAACAEGAVVDRAAWNAGEPRLFTAVEGAPLVAPALGDPRRARKILFLNRFEEARQALLVYPSVENAEELLDDLRDHGFRGRVLEGLSARAFRSIASALDATLAPALDALAAMEGPQDARLAAWLRGEEEIPEIDAALDALGVARDANLGVSDEPAGVFLRLFPQIGVERHPARRMLERLAPEWESSCFDRATERRTAGSYLLAARIAGADLCGGDAFRADLQLGLDRLAEAQNACVQSLATETQPEEWRMRAVERAARERERFAASLGLDARLPFAGLRALREARASRLAGRLAPAQLENLTDDQAERAIRDALDEAVRSQVTGVGNGRLVEIASEATSARLEQVRARLAGRLETCDLQSIAGCDTDSLAGCTLAALPRCNAAAVGRDARALLHWGASSMAHGGEELPDFTLVHRGARVALVGAFDRAEAARRAGNAEEMSRALSSALDAVAAGLQTGDESAAGWETLGAKAGELATLMHAELAAADPATESQDVRDERLATALGVLETARTLGAPASAVGPLRDLALSGASGLVERDTDRLRAALARPVHDRERIELLIHRLNLAVRVPQNFQPNRPIVWEEREPAYAVVQPLFVEALVAQPDRRLAAPTVPPVGEDGTLDDPLSPYARYVLDACLDLPPGSIDGRSRAAGYVLRIAGLYDPDRASHRGALQQLARGVRFRIERERRDAGPDEAGLPPREADPLIAALRALAAQLGDVALAQSVGSYDVERAERFAQALRANAEGARAAFEQLQAELADRPQTVDELRAEVERREALAEMAESSAARFRALRGAEEFPEEELIRELERLSGEEPLLVDEAAAGGRIVSPTLLATSHADRFRAAAAALEPALDRAGAHARLAHRLADRLPSPGSSSGVAVRLAAIPQLAGFLVEETGLLSPAAGVRGRGRGDVMPAALGGDVWDPQALLTAILELSQASYGKSPGAAVAGLAGALLTELGQDAEDPVARAGLVVVSAGVESVAAAMRPAATGAEIDWLVVVEAGANDLAAVYEPGGPPETFWLGLAGRLTQVGIVAIRGGGSADAAAQASMELAFDFLEYPDVAAAIEQVPEPGGSLIVMVKGLMGESLANMAEGDAFDVALARVLSDAAFAGIPAPYGPFGNDLSHWALDFVQAHRAEIEQAIADRDNPLAWKPVTQALLAEDGVPRLTCLVGDHFEELAIPPGIALLPFVGGHELLSSPATFAEAEERPKALLDVSAGLMNLWLSGAAQATCDAPFGLDAEDTPFARQVRALKTLDTSDPYVALNLMGRFGLGAVDTLAPGSTMARAMNTIWWGREDPPAQGVPYTGLGSALTNDVGDAIEFALATPRIAGDVVAILSEDPALEKTMDLLAGNCVPEYLLPPDTCKANTPGKNEGTLPNLLLSSLADFRRQVRPGLSRAQHGSDPAWGYLRTLPMLGPGEGGLPDLARAANPLGWESAVDVVDAMETSSVAMQRGTLAAIDVSRATINVLNSLPTIDVGGPSAQHIQDSSVFVEQTGGEMFSGVAGGLMREWELGTDPDDADIYFELIGQFVIPAAVRAAAQMTYQTQGDDWMLMLRSGSNYPDLNAVGETIGVAVPANEITSAFVGRSESYFAGWLGVANAAPYLQLYGRQKLSFGGANVSDVTFSGFAHDFSGDDPAEQFLNMDLGMCAELEQALIPGGNPQISLYTMGQTPRVTIGGSLFKRDRTFGMGYKLGASWEWSVPVFPIAGIESGADFGSSFEATYDGDWFPEVQLGACVRPFIRGNFFGIQLADFDATMDVAVFGDADDDGAEAGMKMRLRIADDYYDLMRENIGCEAPGFLEAPLCFLIDVSGEDLGGWLTLTGDAAYFGLGPFPQNGDLVLAAPILADGGFGLPELREVEGWGGFSQSPYDTCDDQVCGSIDEPPPGAPVRSAPQMEGAP